MNGPEFRALISVSLQASVSLYVFWISVTPLAPITRVLFLPALLGGFLIGLIVGIGSALVSLPFCFSRFLAVWVGAIGLVRTLWPRSELLTAIMTTLFFA